MGQGLTTFLDFQFSGDGSPEGVVRAPVGAEYRNLTGGALYRKATGAGNTGWVLIVSGTIAITTSQISDASTAGKTLLTSTTPTITASQISDATAFGIAALKVVAANSKVLTTSGAGAPQLSDPSVTAAQISDGTTIGRAFVKFASAAPSTNPAGVIVRVTGAVDCIEGAGNTTVTPPITISVVDSVLTNVG